MGSIRQTVGAALAGRVRSHGLIGDASDECCQQVWVQLAAAMQNFRYDPGLRFRGWLHLFFHRRISDTLKASRSDLAHRQLTGDVAVDPSTPWDDSDPRDEKIVAMLRRAAQVQDAVQARVTPENWEVFGSSGSKAGLSPRRLRFSGDNIPQCTGRTNE